MSERTAVIGEGSPPQESRRASAFDVAEASDTGRVRDHNEDFVLVNEDLFLKSRGLDGLYVVADGMGGHGAGEVASEIAAEVVKQQVGKREFPRGVTQFSQLTSDEQKEWLSGVVDQTNQAIFQRRKRAETSQDDRIRIEGDMGTTLVMAVRFGDEVAIANVGDSRAYMVSKSGEVLRQISQDHSLVANLVAIGQITPAEARVHEQRNVIYRTVGDNPRVEADVFFAKIPAGGELLLCSDGLSGMVEDEQIRQILVSSGSAQEATRRLIAAANAAGGEDNISAIVVKRKPPEVWFSENARRVKELKNKGGKEMNLTQQELEELSELFGGTVTALAEMFEAGISLRIGEKTFTAMELFRIVEADRLMFEKKLLGT